MSYNGSGVFNINTAGQPVVTGTVISSTAFNALTADLATGLTTALTKDGQTTPTANIPMGGFKVTGIAAATTTGDALSYGRAATVSTLTNSALTSGRVPYASTAGLLVDSANLTFNGTTLTANTIGAFTLSGTVAGGGNQINNVIIGTSTPLAGSFTTINASTSITNAGLTSGRVTFAGASGLLTDSANLLYSGTDLTVYGLTVGRGAGAVSTNTAFGVSALQGITSGASNVAIGYQAGYTTQNGTVVAVGYRAAYSTTSGTSIAIGSNAVYANTTQNDIIGIGPSALQLATGASSSIAIGTNASNNASAGTNNVVIGNSAGQSATGSNAVMIGGYAGNAGFGNNCVFIGPSSTAAATSDTSEIILGTNGTTGKGSSTGFINPNSGGVYQGNNSAAWSITSDQRLKKNIVDNTIGLNAISQIQVRNFEYRLPEEITDFSETQAINIKGIQLGAIAQELQQILPDCVKEESTGILSVDTTNLTWYLINAIKELNLKITALESK